MNTLITFLFYSVRAGTPLLLGTTGEIVSEKSGSMNLGVEGMMAMGAIGGYYFGSLFNNFFMALLASFVCAGLGGLIFAVLTITLQANQNVTGLALTIFGVGIYQFAGRTLVDGQNFPNLNEHGGLLLFSSDTGIPVLRDIPYIGKLLFSYNYFVYIAILIAIALWLYIKKSRTGLRMKAVGENPAAADACGVNVNLIRYVHVICGGGICGLGGLYLGLVTNGGAWNENWINGMGWVSVALVIFAGWSPAKAIFGSFFFGMLNALQAWKGNLADAFPKVLGWLGSIPNEFYQMLPFLITALVLIFASVRQKRQNAAPAAVGLNYFREER